ncbi:MAG: zinc-dependent dehydrogenase [Endomicrobiales bacterium]|nr:zinc-dependent dehydrogenase [Endomicrobiales bacterium]
MKAAVYYNNNDIRIEELEKPKIGDKELLVKVHASGICGSDVMEWYRIKKAPIVLGHEISGEIVKAGAKVQNYKVGDRVFVSHHVPCNKCKYCLNGHHTACETLHSTNFDPGGFSEFLRVPEINMECGVFLLPDRMSYEEGTFIEPLGCVVRGQNVARFKTGQSVLILGAGISGILHMLLAKTNGASRTIVTDVNEFRLSKAKELGADVVINAKDNVPDLVRKNNDNMLCDLVVVCTGALSAFEQALKSVDRGGTVLCFGATEPEAKLLLPINEFWRNDITIMPSYGAAVGDIVEAIDLIKSGKVPVLKMITHKLGLSETGQGFKYVSEGKDSLKVIVEPQR